MFFVRSLFSFFPFLSTLSSFSFSSISSPSASSPSASSPSASSPSSLPHPPPPSYLLSPPHLRCNAGGLFFDLRGEIGVGQNESRPVHGFGAGDERQEGRHLHQNRTASQCALRERGERGEDFFSFSRSFLSILSRSWLRTRSRVIILKLLARIIPIKCSRRHPCVTLR